MVVSNSGPLIWLGRYDLLRLLRTAFWLIGIPGAVYFEVVEEGLRRKHLDAQRVKEALDEGWIKVEAADDESIEAVVEVEEKLGIRLGKGEREAIGLALTLKAKVILTNDEDAALASKALGLKPRGILYILLKAVKDKNLTKDEAAEVFNKMLREGFWLSPLIVQRFLNALEKLRNTRP